MRDFVDAWGYERRYGGLRYVTFVNGRTREEGMYSVAGVEKSQEREEGSSLIEVKAEVGGKEWTKELERSSWQ